MDSIYKGDIVWTSDLSLSNKYIGHLMIRRKLTTIIQTQETRSGFTFDLLIHLLILMSLAAYAIETLPYLSSDQIKLLRQFELVSIAVFSIEYLLRVYTSRIRLQYIFSFYGLVDLLAVLPFYLFMSIDMRSIRIFRLLRIFRLIKFLRFNNAIRLLVKSFNRVRDEILVFLFLILMLIYISSVAIYHFEFPVQPDKFQSIFHSMWWSVTTVTTIGYGDMYPVTVWGKLFASLLSIIGIVVVAVPTGLLASSLTIVMEEHREGVDLN